MNKRALKIAILFILFVLIIIYGWNLFQRMNYNKKVYETDIYKYIPQDARAVINFSRNHHFEQYFEVDTVNRAILDPIKDYITYPAVIVKTKTGEDLLLMKATKEQQDNITKIFAQTIAPYHLPRVKKYKGTELYFYSLPENNFLVATFCEGLFAVSADYKQIEYFLDNSLLQNMLTSGNARADHYITKTMQSSPISMFAEVDSTIFALSYEYKNDVITLDGEYFGKLQHDTLKMSYNEMNLLLQLENHFTDSIYWGEPNRMKIWINKLEDETFN